jgi:hypothetical protein
MKRKSLVVAVCIGMLLMASIPTFAVTTTDWMVKVKETDNMVFGRISVDCEHVYGASANICLLGEALNNATNFSVSYVQNWVIANYYNKTESDNRFSPIIWAYNQTTPAITFVQNWVISNFYNKTESDLRFSPQINVIAPITKNVSTNVTIGITIPNCTGTDKLKGNGTDFVCEHDFDMQSDIGNIIYMNRSTVDTNESAKQLKHVNGISWSVPANRTVNFECIIGFSLLDSIGGFGMAVDASPTPSLIAYNTIIASAQWKSGYGTAVNDTTVTNSAPDSGKVYLTNIYGIISSPNNSSMTVYPSFMSNTNGKTASVRTRSSCKWWFTI